MSEQAAQRSTKEGFLPSADRYEDLCRALERRDGELASLRRELDDLTRAAAHDLQEPLRKIMTFGSLLKSHQGIELDAFGIDCLARMESAAERMAELVEGLRLYMRVTAHAEMFLPVDLNAAVKEATSELRLKAAQAGGRIEVDSLPTLRGDPWLLQILFSNLVDNALKFRSKDPPVIKLSVTEAEGRRVFRVRDNGIGIEARYADDIFMPFRRLHPRTQFQGTGIGLALCRRVVDRHGGRIWLEPSAEGGSDFRFTLDPEPAGNA
jgi:light-regulated signal transduction histidine kinase (bacteriophytochrome)